MTPLSCFEYDTPVSNVLCETIKAISGDEPFDRLQLKPGKGPLKNIQFAQ